ncbi:cytochrome oxidase putative small subunit CydP [Methylocystis sp. B8]|uniref:cytochrome oxidase putative small subunit CydP n=1 Tax=Methylocystis sp. B8 TaxID=544938 RepID=UPI0010FE4148|nr:cytochrome oxidase putative small subunit CydP [Methylocystis sp. B8]TLG75675.1 phosphoglycerate mutase [Methylocystis sp. B8]
MRTRPLGREIAIALAFKLMALVALYLMFFGPAHRIKVTPAEMAETLSAAAPR